MLTESTPSAESSDLWTSLLTSVSSNKAVPIKNIVVLGDSNSGRSTLVRALQETSLGNVQLAIAEENDSNAADFALGYSYCDIRDDEDTVARIGIFQLSTAHAFEPLLAHALNAASLSQTLLVLVLDWESPWAFAAAVERWMHLLENSIADVDPEERQALLDHVESFVRDHIETDYSTANSDEKMVMPLPEGSLTHNIGLPIAIVCSKSDTVHNLERLKEFKESTFDFVQQTLRTLCLKYGASLHYTSTHKPQTFLTLRNYILHRLIELPFTEKPNVVGKDDVFVPTGWDSFGKIKALGDFDCVAFSRSVSMSELYSTVIQPPRADQAAFLPATVTITAEEDQLFLDKHASTMERDERASPVNSATQSTSLLAAPSSSHSTSVASPASQVGSGIQSIEDVTAKLQRLQQHQLTAQTKATISSTSVSTSVSSTISHSKTSSSSPSATGNSPAGHHAASLTAAASATNGGGNQNEVLANFFQSLLNRKTTVAPKTEKN